MKAVVLQENLAKALSVVSRSVSSKPSTPVLANVCMRENQGILELATTNMEMGVRLTVPAKVEKGFGLTVPCRQLTEFVSGMSAGQMELTIVENKLKVKGDKFKADISGIAVDEFPVIPETSGSESVVVAKEEWIKGLSKVVFAAAADEGRPVLTGVLLDITEGQMTVVATDGYRLGKVQLTVKSANLKPEEEKLIVPAKAINELLRLSGDSENEEMGIWVTKEANQVIFKLGQIEFVSRLIEGNFPDYRKIIPTETSTKITVDRHELMRAVKLAAVFARESANVVKFKLLGEMMMVGANSPQLGEDESEVPIKREGDEFEVAFNYKYLIDWLNSVDEDEVIYASSGSLAPGVFKSTKEDRVLHIVMPVRVQGS